MRPDSEHDDWLVEQRCFRSAIEWPEMGTGSEVIEGDQPVGWKPFAVALVEALDRAAHAYTIADRCESPIEVDLGAELLKQLYPLLKPIELIFVPQYRWHPYRMDWTFLKRDQPVLFIECDGKEFHSTPEQKANDAAKDAAARNAGIPLLRFSGEEIFRNPEGCANRILEHLIRIGAI